MFAPKGPPPDIATGADIAPLRIVGSCSPPAGGASLARLLPRGEPTLSRARTKGTSHRGCFLNSGGFAPEGLGRWIAHPSSRLTADGASTGQSIGPSSRQACLAWPIGVNDFARFGAKNRLVEPHIKVPTVLSRHRVEYRR